MCAFCFLIYFLKLFFFTIPFQGTTRVLFFCTKETDNRIVASCVISACLADQPSIGEAERGGTQSTQEVRHHPPFQPPYQCILFLFLFFASFFLVFVWFCNSVSVAAIYLHFLLPALLGKLYCPQTPKTRTTKETLTVQTQKVV